MKMICYKAAKYLQRLPEGSLWLQNFAYVNSQMKKKKIRREKDRMREKNTYKVVQPLNETPIAVWIYSQSVWPILKQY